MFNGSLAKVLAEEIADAAAALTDDSVRIRPQPFGEFVSRIADRIHVYVKFVGD